MLYRFEAVDGKFTAITDVQNGANLPLERGPWQVVGTLMPDDPEFSASIVRAVVTEGFVVSPAA